MLAPSGTASLTPGAPVKFTEEELKKFTNHIEQELEDGLEEHRDRESRIDEWQRLYDGTPKTPTRNFPWPGAANLEVPLVGFTTDSIVARILNTVFSMEPFWTVRPLRKEVDPIAKPTEHYLDWSRKAEYNLYRAFKPAVIQCTKFGWAWLKYGWENYTRRDYTLDNNGDVKYIDEIIRRPVVYHVPCQDLIIQAGVEDERIAEWLCHRVRLTDNQMLMRKQDNLYANVDELLKKKDYEIDMENEGRRYPRERLNTLYEFNIGYPIDGVPVELIATYHRPSKQFTRIIHNPYPWRNYTKLTFIEREGKLEGFGIARRLYQLQEEISTIHRQEVDNATVANTRFFLGKRGAVRPGTQIWPGRFLTVSDPERDIKAFQLGDIGVSLRSLEVQALGYAERASGISDPQLGRESQSMGSRATATGTLAMIQEGNRRFDLNVRDIRESGSEIGRRVLEINQRFRPQGASYFIEGADGQYVEQVLNLPAEFSAAKLSVELTASTATINRETEKQGLIGLLGVMTNYYERIIQSAMIVANPQIPGEVKELVVKVSEGAKHIVDRIVQDFDIRDVNTVVPALMNHEAMMEMQSGQIGSPPGGASPGNAPPIPGNPQGGGADPGVGSLLPVAGGAGGAGPNGA